MSRTEHHDDMQVNANDVVAFIVEVATLVLLGVAGWQLGGPTAVRVLLALALPGAAAVLWGLFAAPRARVRSRPMELATKVVVLGLYWHFVDIVWIVIFTVVYLIP